MQTGCRFGLVSERDLSRLIYYRYPEPQVLRQFFVPHPEPVAASERSSALRVLDPEADQGDSDDRSE